MKILLTLTLTLVILLPSFGKPKQNGHTSVHIIAAKMDVFYFKVHSDMIGADIEVYNEQGEKLITQKIERHRAIVDFYNEQPGRYLIKITKGQVQEVFDYVKTEPSPFVALDVKPVTIEEL